MKAPDAFRTISEVAQDLDLPQHVLRFWETRFVQIKPMKRGGGRRYYRPEDVDLLRGIRLLLYAEGFTIRGVQRLLKENGVGFVVGVGQSGSVQAAKGVVGQADGDHLEEDAAESEGEALHPEPQESRDRTIPSAPQKHAASSAARAGVDAEPQPDQPSRPAYRPISPEGRRRIEMALADLLEAKRLLDAVR